MKILLIALSLITTAQAYEYPYNPLDKSYSDKAESIVEIKDTTPIKTQDGIGFCYGFSTTSLLESYRCRELSLDCSDPKEMLSTFDVTSFYGDKGNTLTEGGNAYPILKKLAKLAPLSIAREECIPFSSLAHQIIDKKKTMKRNEGKGWDYLISKWKEYKGNGPKSSDCVACLAKDIKTTLGNLKTPADQIADAFSTATDVEDFLYKTILPKECLEEKNRAPMPAFKAEFYPDGLHDTSDEMLQGKIEELLNNKIPLEIGICADKSYTPNCEDKEGHSISLFGIKEVCNKSGECRKMVKVKNSYGMGWQKKNNDGWLDLKELVHSSNSLQSYQNITWITKP
ncbi:MAG: hypothetical protein H7177_06200 [Rhizobacter sp.]|nr:hypothetical protein [Bacteriovorax sp.]